MNYQALKGMVEGIIETYKCPYCNEAIGDVNVDIIGAAGNSTNIDITCLKCGKNAIVKSQMLNLDTEQLKELANQENGMQKVPTTNSKKNIKSIKDNQIVDLNKNLKKEGMNVDDLFGN